MSDYEETFNLSYWRALGTSIDGVQFMDAFYERFLSSSQEVAALFANTDFKRQKQMLKKSLVFVASFNPIQGPDDTMQRLVIRHRELDVKLHLYQMWLDNLLETVKEYDPEYEEAVDEAWRKMLTPGIEFMIAQSSA